MKSAGGVLLAEAADRLFVNILAGIHASKEKYYVCRINSKGEKIFEDQSSLIRLGSNFYGNPVLDRREQSFKVSSRKVL